MELHFKVRSVMLTEAGAALTLDPVEWVTPTAWEDDGSESEWEDASPDHLDAEPVEPGGKLTELRVVGNPGLVPGDFCTLTMEPTVHHWSPGVPQVTEHPGGGEAPLQTDQARSLDDEVHDIIQAGNHKLPLL